MSEGIEGMHLIDIDTLKKNNNKKQQQTNKQPNNYQYHLRQQPRMHTWVKFNCLESEYFMFNLQN